MDVKALNRGFTLFWLALIGILSLLPGKTFEDLGYDFFGADKFVHAFLYYFLARSLIKTSEGFGKNIPPLLLALAASLGWGGLMEILQGQEFIIGRSCDGRDLIANAAGSLAALIPLPRRRG